MQKKPSNMYIWYRHRHTHRYKIWTQTHIKIWIPMPSAQCSICSRRIQKVFDCFPTLSHKCIKYNRQLHLDFLSSFNSNWWWRWFIIKCTTQPIQIVFGFASDSFKLILIQLNSSKISTNSDAIQKDANWNMKIKDKSNWSMFHFEEGVC